jgi:cation diffusion facilitator family transporter
MEELGHGFTALLSMRSHAVEKPQCARLISGMSYGNNERRLTNAVNLLTPLGEQRRHASCVPIFGVLRRSAMWLVSTISSRLRSLKRDLHLHGLGNDTSDKTLQEAQDVTMVGLIKNIVLTIGKGVVGLTANSQALVADAAHSLSDIIADVVALVTLHVAHLPADKEHPYGHGKYEPIGALCISSLLISAGLGLAWNSVGLVQEMLYTSIIPVVPGKAALWLSIAAISLNEALFRMTIRAGEQAKSQTVIANAWHHRSDALSSIVAMVGISLAMAGFPILDPIAGGCVGLMIASTGGQMILESVGDLTDTCDEQVVSSVETILLGIPDVVECKSVRNRSMGPSQIVDAHLLVKGHLSLSAAEHIVATARAAVQKKLPEVTEIVVRASPVYTGAVTDSYGDAEVVLEDLPSHHEIQERVGELIKRELQDEFDGMCVCQQDLQVQYVGGRVHLSCIIGMEDKTLRMHEANRVGERLQSKILGHLPYLSRAEILLKLGAPSGAARTKREGRRVVRESRPTRAEERGAGPPLAVQISRNYIYGVGRRNSTPSSSAKHFKHRLPGKLRKEVSGGRQV